MSDSLWRRSVGWRWLVSITVLLSGMLLVIGPWRHPHANTASFATYTPPQNSTAKSTQGFSVVVQSTASTRSTSNSLQPKSLQTASNPAFNTSNASTNGPGTSWPAGTELHLIGVYQGDTPEGEKGNPWWEKCQGFRNDPIAMSECHKKNSPSRIMRSIAVDVLRSGVPVVLVLMSYEPVKWKVSVGSGSRIAKIILSGYHGQDIEGVPDSVPVEARTHESSPCINCSRQADYFYTYTQDSPEYKKVVGKLEQITGLSPTSFQGRRQATRFSITGNSVAISSAGAKTTNENAEAYIGKSFQDTILLAGQSISIPEGEWLGLAYTAEPSKRGKDRLVVLGRRNGDPFKEIIAVRVQTAGDGNGFAQFRGCENTPHYAGQIVTNESFGAQLCYEVVHATDAWAQPLFAMAQKQLHDYRVATPDTVIASSFHKADKRQSLDLIFYALPVTYHAGEQWESSSWHPKNLISGSTEANFVRDQVKRAETWFQLFRLSL